MKYVCYYVLTGGGGKIGSLGTDGPAGNWDGELLTLVAWECTAS